MENADGECAKDDGSQLNRNRSLKSKQLVRSQAIRESTSPPRTISPSFQPPYKGQSPVSRNDRTSPYQNPQASSISPCPPYHATPASDTNSPNNRNQYQSNERVTSPNGRYQVTEQSSQEEYDKCDKRKTVEIQITGGGCNTEQPYCGARVSCDARLLSQAPRTACVCDSCSDCPQCRGKRRRHKCPTKQDSGIVCSDDGADCSDTEQNGNSYNMETKKSLDVDDQFYCRCPERKDKPKSISLNRSDSGDKQEPTGPELVSFIKETLNKNGRDRVTLLKIEKELHSFVNDNGRCIVKFPVMSSYGRMLVHRCASLFQLAHYLDHYNKNCVIVSKTGTSGGCIPCTSFKTWCVSNFPPSPRHHNDNTLTRSILKRDTHSLDEPSCGSLSLNRSKSLEQREKEYERVRRRIFSSDNCNQDESQWPWLNTGPVKLLTPDPARHKLLKVQSLEGQPSQGQGQGQGQGGWRNKSGPVSKSHSFGGYVEHPRTLSRQGDLASSSWRLSPSSSGYKTLSLRSTDSVTPSPTGGGTPEPATAGAVVWAVTDLAAVPPGALVIHPQTGRPLTNPDGSVYRFDPANPPTLYDPQYNDRDKQIDANNEKRRGRLEKQNSFIDNDSECQQTNDCRNKCCCECRRHENQAKPQDKEQPKPATPVINQPKPEPANHNQPQQQPANHSAPEQPVAERDTNSANQRQFDNQRSFEANRKDMAQDVVYSYNQGYSEEVSSPPQMNQFYQPDMMNMMQAKMTPVPVHDPNIRPLSLTNMMYGPTVPPAYHYIPNHCRMDQLQQPVYAIHQQEEPKPMTTPQQEPFRIDPSYPYAPLEYGACACAEPAPQQRNVGVYGQSEVPAVGAAPLPLHSVIMPPVMPHYPMQYQEPVQWVGGPKLVDMCPVVYPPQYTHYNIVYPQMVPPTYPYCPPVYPDKGGIRPTPPSHDRHTDNDENITNNMELIKDQMAVMSVKRDNNKGGRNSGNGILGSYPSHTHPLNARNSNIQQEDAQLSSAARAIVNSIRNLQAKNTYQEKRFDQAQRPDRRQESDRKLSYRPQYLFRQMSPGTWCRQSPAPVHPVMNQPRRPHPDSRNVRR